MSSKSARRHPRSASSPTASSAAPSRVEPARADAGGWQWRTFPVFFALCVGLLAASIINGRPSNTAAAIVQIGALLGVVYGVIHMIVRNIVRAGHARFPDFAARRRRSDEHFEDELVYPDDTPARP